MKLPEGSKQYNRKVDPWEAIKIAMSDTELAEVKKVFFRIQQIISITSKKHDDSTQIFSSGFVLTWKLIV